VRAHDEPAVPPREGELDPESADWLASLAPHATNRAAALARLHRLVLAAALTELGRRQAGVTITGPELDDLAHQAADDALMAIIGKLETFAGRSKFTTWAYKFAILEVSSKLGRHFWQRPGVALDVEQWDRLPDRFGLTPEEAAQSADLLRAVRDCVEHVLTEHQRAMFVAVVLNGVPLDAVVARLGTNRNAVYKTVFDARRKIRETLVADGYLPEEARRP
jgi:RNA polymerase sigma-70 factor (ECF subfamily)